MLSQSLLVSASRAVESTPMIEIPAGPFRMGSDNGNVYGAAIRAAVTITFIGLKPGLLTRHGPDYCGEILLRALDLEPSSLVEPHAWKLDQAYAQ
mgnify:CR=1 FL=1